MAFDLPWTLWVDHILSYQTLPELCLVSCISKELRVLSCNDLVCARRNFSIVTGIGSLSVGGDGLLARLTRRFTTPHLAAYICDRGIARRVGVPNELQMVALIRDGGRALTSLAIGGSGARSPMIMERNGADDGDRDEDDSRVFYRTKILASEGVLGSVVVLCPNLESLSLTWVNNLSPECVNFILGSSSLLKNIRVLDFSGCEGVSGSTEAARIFQDGGLQIPLLEVLDFTSTCMPLQLNIFHAIPRAFPRLQFLGLGGTGLACSFDEAVTTPEWVALGCRVDLVPQECPMLLSAGDAWTGSLSGGMEDSNRPTPSLVARLPPLCLRCGLCGEVLIRSIGANHDGYARGAGTQDHISSEIYFDQVKLPW